MNMTEKMFTNPNVKLTEDYITGRFGRDDCGFSICD
jgi:ABC-type phosphate transport system ATPase subunit